MQLHEWAKIILLGDRLEDKLLSEPAWTELEDTEPGPALLEAPRFPGRPRELSQIGKSDFPKLKSLGLDSERGKLLHFFANHELLATELMAWLLLKFPGAPPAFRASIARTIQEEQGHLRLYIDRMRELGVDFGVLPVSDYFWNVLKDMVTPMQFVVQMSLTFEQANLDFSLYYQQAIAEVGDEKTSQLLERVYLDEISHVKNGLTWFNRWRLDPTAASAHPGAETPAQSEDDWDAYLRLLPPPMTPRRAKGLVYSAEARRLAGFSERYIRELEVFSGSKGRPPVFWFYNPLCEAEIARGRPGLSPSETVRDLNLDLETLPMFLALEEDVALVQVLPRAEWLKELKTYGFEIPEFRLQNRVGPLPRESALAGIEPWGWSPDILARFRPWRDLLINVDGGNSAWSREVLEKENFALTGLAALYSKVWSVGYLREWLIKNPDDQAVFGSLEDMGEVYSDWASARERLSRALSEGEPWIAKAPWGTSGTLNKRVLEESELAGPIGGWIRNILATQGAIVLEPWLNKEADLSLQIEVQASQVKHIGIRRFSVGSRLEYRGTDLDPKLSRLSPTVLEFLHTPIGPEGRSPLERWTQFASELGARLRELGYLGPAGLDALVCRHPEYSGISGFFIKPLVELNPRWTMGRVAIELETHLVPGTVAEWRFLPVRELAEGGLPASPRDAARVLRERHPIRLETSGGRTWIAEGVLFTNDPECAREVLTCVMVQPRS